MDRIFNFSAGPATLPLEVLETARDELTDLIERDRQTREREHTAGWG